MRVVPLATGHGNGPPVVFVSFVGIRWKQVPSYFSTFSSGFSVIGVAALYNKILHHSVELGAIKILLSGQVNEIGFVVRNIIVQLNGKAAHGGGESNLIFFQFFGIVKKEID